MINRFTVTVTYSYDVTDNEITDHYGEGLSLSEAADIDQKNLEQMPYILHADIEEHQGTLYTTVVAERVDV